MGPSKPSSCDDLNIDELFRIHQQSLPWSPGCSVECSMVFVILRVLTRGVWWNDWNGDIFYFTRNSSRLGMMLTVIIELGASLRSRSGGDVDSSRRRNRSFDRPHA